MKKSVIKKYAKVVARVGANVQQGQEVIISVSINQADFACMVQDECYKAGASKVTIEWQTPANILINRVKHETIETMGKVEDWEVEKAKHLTKVLPARIYIDSESPDELKNLNQEKYAQSRMLRYPILKPFSDEMDGKYQWTIVAVPSKEWAKMVFPDLSPSKAVDALWNAILHTARITDDPVKAWDDHNADLLNRCKWLNSQKFDYLKYYSASSGTDFKVWLNDKLAWLGGGELSLQNVYYNPNMPTEECFTTPIKGKAEGRLVASKPLSYNGDIIDGFSFEFKDGKVVSYHAQKGEELLKHMLGMDENACYLGECALVPFESPVNETGILFYNTLFDENAVCHFALGAGFEECVINREQYTKEEIKAMPINDSMIHVDFMVGTRDLSIIGVTKDGKEVPIFKNGTWTF